MSAIPKKAAPAVISGSFRYLARHQGRRMTGKIGVLPVDAGVVERGRVLIHEKVPVEPA
jgi:hypothetical protein